MLKKTKILISALIISILVSGCSAAQMMKVLDIVASEVKLTDYASTSFELEDIPEFDGEPYVTINNNVPFFSNTDLSTESFEHYSELDYLGRCGLAYANLSIDTMPEEERGKIGSIKPSGWQLSKYDFIDGKYLYNRCHLIGYQLSGENANKLNLITGTRYLNIKGMLPFENETAQYIETVFKIDEKFYI